MEKFTQVFGKVLYWQLNNIFHALKSEVIPLTDIKITTIVDTTKKCNTLCFDTFTREVLQHEISIRIYITASVSLNSLNEGEEVKMGGFCPLLFCFFAASLINSKIQDYKCLIVLIIKH